MVKHVGLRASHSVGFSLDRLDFGSENQDRQGPFGTPSTGLDGILSEAQVVNDEYGV